ncbi:MAG: hypothetical protein IJC97_00860 [Oscillospiraceae bacterium]|nr:hypothetical protein [Oscillospiraceae bacterium]
MSHLVGKEFFEYDNEVTDCNNSCSHSCSNSCSNDCWGMCVDAVTGPCGGGHNAYY